MEKIAIITDSSCDLSSAYMEENKVSMLPLKIIYKQAEYRDRVEISADEIYARLGQEVPRTSLPSPQDVKDTLERLANEGFTHVVGIFISSGLSGTFNMVKQMVDDFDALKIELIDSKSLSLGLGFSVHEAVKGIQEGLAFNDIVNQVKEATHKIKCYYVIKTLEYLKKGGRIGKVEGTVGDLLNIKPIISVNEEGVYYTFKKVRGRQRSISELLDLVKTNTSEKLRIGILHGEAEEEARGIEKVIRSLENVKEVFFNQISPVLTVHTGPGLIGVVIQELT